MISFKLEVDKPDAIVNLKARKTIAGDVIIYDHPDIDIVVSPKENKVFALAKKEFGDHIYATQSILFEFLSEYFLPLIGNLHVEALSNDTR